MNDALKQINKTLLSFAIKFTQQNKAMADLKTSFDNFSLKMENTALHSQHLVTSLDVTDPVLKGMAHQDISTAINETKQVDDAPLKVLKIYNPLQYQDEDLSAFFFDH